MSFAHEIKIKTNEALNNNERLNEVWQEIKKKIEKAASEGKRYITGWSYRNGVDQDVLENKIREEGFEVKWGHQIHNDYHNLMSRYIVW